MFGSQWATNLSMTTVGVCEAILLLQAHAANSGAFGRPELFCVSRTRPAAVNISLMICDKGGEVSQKLHYAER
jgi:hypothetical protein